MMDINIAIAWTPERVIELRCLCGEKLSAGLIAERMGVSRNTIIGKARRIGVRIIGVHKMPRGKKSHGRNQAIKSTSRSTHKLRQVDAPSIQPIPFKQRQANATPLHVSLLDLQPRQCRWPYNDNPPFSFCGCTTPTGQPYCEPHAQLSRNAAAPRITEDERDRRMVHWRKIKGFRKLEQFDEGAA